MSLNQFSSPNTYLPVVQFNEANINNADITNLQMPLSVQNAYTAPSNKVSMFVDGANTALKVQGLNAGVGAYIQLESPSGDQDIRLAVSNTGACVLALKSDLSVQDKNFIPSLQLNKSVGDGLKIFNNVITNYSASNLNAYMTSNFSLDIAGFSNPVSISCSATRVGNLVTLDIGGCSELALGGIINSTALPEPYRPSIAIEGSIPTTSSNFVLDSGVCEILNTGVIEFEYTAGTLFPNQPTSGWNRFCVSYVV